MKRTLPFEMDRLKRDDEDDDAFHFVAYIPHQGYLYELDGLRKAPINHGPIVNEKRWIDEVAKPVIQKRIEQYTGKEIRFNLMAVIKSHESTLRTQLINIESRITAKVCI
jgi:ubiquitin carboxyl-terminal hydrolase L5